MSDLSGGEAEVHLTITITRKATGAVETYHLIGRERSGEPDPAPKQPPQPAA